MSHQIYQSLEVVVKTQVLLFFVVLIQLFNWNLHRQRNWLYVAQLVNYHVVLNVHIVSSVFTRNQTKQLFLLFRLRSFGIEHDGAYVVLVDCDCLPVTLAESG